MMRLNRFLAQSGLGARRTVEQLIVDGHVMINGVVVRDLSTQVDGEVDRVEVNGRNVRPRNTFTYILMHKPHGYDVTRGHQHHRRAYDLLPKDTHASVQAVGRLDRNSTGLLLFTNDGDLAFRLTHPRYGCPKVYEIEIEGALSSDNRNLLLEGIELEDGPAKAVQIEELPRGESGLARLEVVMAEGRKHIVRRLLEAVGNHVVELHRTAMGPLRLEDLQRGRTRPLTQQEVKRLYQRAGLRQGEETTEKPGRARKGPTGRTPAPHEDRFEQDQIRIAGSPGTSRIKSRPAPRTETAGTKPRPRQLFAMRDKEEIKPDGDFYRAKRAAARPHAESSDRPDRAPADRPRSPRPGGSDRPSFDRPRPNRPSSNLPRFSGPASDRPRQDRPDSDRPRSPRPASGGGSRPDRSASSDRPRAPRPAFDRPRQDRPDSDRPRSPRPASGGGSRPDRSASSDRPRAPRPAFDRPRQDRPDSDRPRSPRPASGGGSRPDRPGSSDRPRAPRPGGADRTGRDRPDAGRPRTPRSGSDRPGSDRPTSHRPYSDNSSGKPARDSKSSPRRDNAGGKSSPPKPRGRRKPS